MTVQPGCQPNPSSSAKVMRHNPDPRTGYSSKYLSRCSLTLPYCPCCLPPHHLQRMGSSFRSSGGRLHIVSQRGQLHNLLYGRSVLQRRYAPRSLAHPDRLLERISGPGQQAIVKRPPHDIHPYRHADRCVRRRPGKADRHGHRRGPGPSLQVCRCAPPGSARR